MRMYSLLVQPVDASDGESFVIMDESTGNEIELDLEKAWFVLNSLHQLLAPNEWFVLNSLHQLLAPNEPDPF